MPRFVPPPDWFLKNLIDQATKSHICPFSLHIRIFYLLLLLFQGACACAPPSAHHSKLQSFTHHHLSHLYVHRRLFHVSEPHPLGFRILGWNTWHKTSIQPHGVIKEMKNTPNYWLMYKFGNRTDRLDSLDTSCKNCLCTSARMSD